MPDLSWSTLNRRISQPGSDVWRVHYDAVARLAAGEDVILLSVGDPDFDTPGYISQHVIECINAGRTHYSPVAGEDNLREAVAELERTATGRDIGPEHVVVFPGATATLYAVLATILDAGDGIVVPEPMYIGYHGMLSAVGADVQPVPLAPPTFLLDVDAVMAAVQPNTRAVLVNTPGNPLGNIIPAETLRDLAAACAARSLWLICDEVYSLITFEAPHVSLLKCAETFRNVVVVDGLSKSHAMSGWRVGWAVAERPMAEALGRFSSAALFGTCQFVQDAAAFALANDAEDVERMREAYEARRDFVLQRVTEHPLLDAFRPQGGMFVMIDGGRICQSGDDFCRTLLEECGVSTLPGSGFGPSASRYVRLSLTENEETLGRAFDRIEKLS